MVEAGDLGDPLGAAEVRGQPVGENQDPDDLAEPEGDDRQVVAAEPQHRGARMSPA